MHFEVAPQVLATIISGVIVLVAGGIAWGSLIAQMKGVHKRLDGINGRIDDHAKSLDDQGQRIAHQEGAAPHGD